MLIQKSHTFFLENFEGPLDFLLGLIQKEEVDIYDISICELIQQFSLKMIKEDGPQLEKGAEFIGMTAYLVWLKSKTLLSKPEELLSIKKEEDPHFEIIRHLVDYYHFKQAAKELAKRQEQQSACFFRGVPPISNWKKPLGIQHLSLEELGNLFKDMMSRTSISKPSIDEEQWRVTDQIRTIQLLIQEHSSFKLEIILNSTHSRLQCIVIFLAILELMKIGEIGIGRENDNQTILIFKKSRDT